MTFDEFNSIFIIPLFLFFFLLGFLLASYLLNFFRRFFHYWEFRNDETFLQILKKSFHKNELLDD